MSIPKIIETVSKEDRERNERQDAVIAEMKKARLKAELLEAIEIRRLNKKMNPSAK